MTNQHSLAARALCALSAHHLPASFVGPANRLLGLNRIEQLYEDLRAEGGARPLPEKLLDRLQIQVVFTTEDRDKVPTEGPVLAVANHPFGLLDAACLAALLPKRRPDVQFLSNQILDVIPEMRERLIAVDPDDGRRGSAVSIAGLRKALALLKNGGMLTAFPAGEVSHWQAQTRRVEDRRWSSSIGGLARRSGATVVPIYIEGSNGLLFQLAGMLHPKLRTALLARELLNKQRHVVQVRVGTPIPAQKLAQLETDTDRADYLRWRTYLLQYRQEFKARTSVPFLPRSTKPRRLRAIASARPAELLRKEVEALPAEACLAAGELACFVASASSIPNVLEEIGRHREISFRQVGEGTGRPRDLDRFDPYYQHLFLWDRENNELAGAYRFARVDDVRAKFGRTGLYTATLFRYPDALLDAMGPCLELGRSFVSPAYQTSFSPLLTLWKGISRYVEINPAYKTLFGPVSISALYKPICRKLMASFLTGRLAMPDWSSLVRPRHPLSTKNIDRDSVDLEDLCQVLGDIDPERPGLPVLLRQYLRLGGKLLGFNVDTDFGEALDGLIVVDLTRTDPKLLARYMGKDASRRFLAHHQMSRAS